MAVNLHQHSRGSFQFSVIFLSTVRVVILCLIAEDNCMFMLYSSLFVLEVDSCSAKEKRKRGGMCCAMQMDFVASAMGQSKRQILDT